MHFCPHRQLNDDENEVESEKNENDYEQRLLDTSIETNLPPTTTSLYSVISIND